MKKIVIWVINKLLGLVTLISAEDICDIVKEYYENGQLMWEIPYVRGKKHGTWKGYYENGQLMWEIRYELGKLI